MTMLTYRYGPSGRKEAVALDCAHGTTIIGPLEIYLAPEAFTALVIRHRSAYGCECTSAIDECWRHWPDARDALTQFTAMVASIPPTVDSLDVDVTLRQLADLRENVPCPSCVVSWTTTNRAGLVSSQFTHEPECGAIAARRRAGTERSVFEPIRRSPAA